MADERVRNVEELLSDFPEGPHGERWLRLIRAAIEREKREAFKQGFNAARKHPDVCRHTVPYDEPCNLCRNEAGDE